MKLDEAVRLVVAKIDYLDQKIQREPLSPNYYALREIDALDEVLAALEDFGVLVPPSR